MRTLLWMVEQRRTFGDVTVPIRSVARAKTRRRARERAERAAEDAARVTAGDPGVPAGPAYVLYPVSAE